MKERMTPAPAPPFISTPCTSLHAGVCKVSWENTTLQVVVTVFGLAVETSPQNAG
jgi:hypothetical protein